MGTSFAGLSASPSMMLRRAFARPAPRSIIPTSPWIPAIVDLCIDGEAGAITAQLLRDLQLGAIEQLLNGPECRKALDAGFDAQAGADLRPDIALSHFQGLKRSSRTSPKKRERHTRKVEAANGRPGLARPTTGRLTDEFLQRVSEFYLDALARGERPIITIERWAGVPRNTASRWVWRAQTEGFLAKEPTKPRNEGSR